MIRRNMQAGTIATNTDITMYENFLASAFQSDQDILALYNAKYDRQVWKLHRESEGMLQLQVREYLNGGDVQQRRARQHLVGQNFFNWTWSEYEAKAYDPFAKSKHASKQKNSTRFCSL